MIAPQNQTQNPAQPETVMVEAGRSLFCRVEAASDKDHWVKRHGAESTIYDQGDVNDTIHYVWTEGADVTPFGNNISAQWIAPTVPGTYTLKCVSDDTPLPIIPPDTVFPNSSTNDDPIIAQVTVQVYAKEWSSEPSLPEGQLFAMVSTVRPNTPVQILAPRGWDFDTWTAPTGETGTSVAETPLYNWTASQGRVLINGYSSTMWIAPETVPAAGVDVQITCIIKDRLTEGQTGVNSPETGTRYDPPSPPTILTIHVAPNPCGEWKHRSWTPATAVVWTFDNQGRPSSQTPSVTETLKWEDLCDAADVQPDVTETRPYRLLYRRTVYIGDTLYVEVAYQAFSRYGGEPTAVLIDRKPLSFIWEVGDGLTDGPATTVPQDLVLGPEENLSVAVSQVLDLDKWTRNGVTGTEPDGVRYVWSSGGVGSFIGNTNNGTSVTWKAPPLAQVPAGTEGLTVTLTCTIDDAWSGNETGVTAPATGSRNDNPLPQHTFNLRVLRVPCGRWQHKSWEAGTITWTTDANGDPEPITPANAIETVEWVDACAGTTRPDETHQVPYILLSDAPVNENGIWCRKVEYGAYSTCANSGNTPTSSILTDKRGLIRHWSLPGDLEGGTLSISLGGAPTQAPPTTAQAGQVTMMSLPSGTGLVLSLAGAADTDTFTRWHLSEQVMRDIVRYKWTVMKDGGTSEEYGTGTSLNWTSRDAGTYIITGQVDDAWEQGATGVTAPDRGDRNDAPLTHTIIVVVTPTERVWQQGSDVTVNLTAPTTPSTVETGQTIDLTAVGSDSDHWLQGTQSGDEADPVRLSWDSDAGEFTSVSPDGGSATWKAPDEPGTYSIQVSAYDDVDDQTERFDDDESTMTTATVTYTVTVVAALPRDWSLPTPMNAGTLTGVTNDSNITAGTLLTLAVEGASDVDHWTRTPNAAHPNGESGDQDDAITYSWSSPGTTFEGSQTEAEALWQAPDVPGDYVISVKVNDVGLLGPEDTGVRDDEGVTGITHSVTVHVLPKVWAEGAPVTLERSDPSAETVTTVPGRVITLQVAGSDMDSWSQGVEQGEEADDLHYHWPQNVTVDPQNPEAATWTAPNAPGTYTITCTADDNGSTRFDDTETEAATVTWTVTVVSPESLEVASIKIRRHTSGNDFGDAATTAAGAVATSEHNADVEILVTDDQGNPKPNVTIPQDQIVLTNEKGLDGNGVVDQNSTANDAKFTPDQNYITDTNGKISGSLSSSNVIGAVGISLDRGVANNPTATTEQVWSNRSQWVAPLYDATKNNSPIIFKPQFTGREDAVDAVPVPINEHAITFKIVAIGLTGPTHEQLDIYATSDFDENAANVVVARPRVQNLDMYAKIAEQSPTEHQPSQGCYATQVQILPGSQQYVEMIWLKATDGTVWEVSP